MSAFGAKRLNKREATPGGSRGGKGLTQGEQPLGGRGSDTEPKCRVDPNDGYPREEPGALAAHVGICAGGEEKSSSLPRPFGPHLPSSRKALELPICSRPGSVS